MNIGLALEIDLEIERLSATVVRIEDRLKEHFASRQYGDDVQAIFIGVILTATGSESLHPIRPLEYRKQYTFKMPITGEKRYLGNVVEFDVKPDYATVRTLNSMQADRYIVSCLVDGLAVLRQHQRKFPKFDVEQFVEDFAMCLSGNDDQQS